MRGRVLLVGATLLVIPLFTGSSVLLDPVMTVWNSDVDLVVHGGGDWHVDGEAKTWLSQSGTVSAGVSYDIYGFGGETWEAWGEKDDTRQNSTFAHAQTNGQDSGSSAAGGLCLEIWQSHWAEVGEWSDEDTLFTDGCPNGGSGGEGRRR